jgi:hypothetical protein
MNTCANTTNTCANTHTPTVFTLPTWEWDLLNPSCQEGYRKLGRCWEPWDEEDHPLCDPDLWAVWEMLAEEAGH